MVSQRARFDSADFEDIIDQYHQHQYDRASAGL
jgi:hypothetical protein